MMCVNDGTEPMNQDKSLGGHCFNCYTHLTSQIVCFIKVYKIHTSFFLPQSTFSSKRFFGSWFSLIVYDLKSSAICWFYKLTNSTLKPIYFEVQIYLE
jgi:hypothetical protein